MGPRTARAILWPVAIFGAAYWAVSEVLAGRWSWRRVDLRRTRELVADMKKRREAR